MVEEGDVDRCELSAPILIVASSWRWKGVWEGILVRTQLPDSVRMERRLEEMPASLMTMVLPPATRNPNSGS